MIVNRWGHANYAVLNDDTIYTFGGNGVLKSAEMRMNNNISKLEDMPTGLSWLSVT